jgi:heat shock 70kDa protein 1/2/6/8
VRVDPFIHVAQREESNADPLYFLLDLGTTYSCVGVWESERVEIIANEQGNRTTPSYVAFSDNERLVGDAAKNQAAMNPKNTVFDAKRLIGRRFDDSEVKADMKNWPFTVADKDGNPFVQVDFEGETKTYSPQGKKQLLSKQPRVMTVCF